MVMHVPALLRILRATPLEAGDGDEPPAQVPCLVHLDSCKGYHNGTAIGRAVVEWLQAEASKRRWTADVARAIEHLPVIEQEVPQQPNDTCCGVYMLQGIEHFIATWPEVRQWNVLQERITHFSKMSFEHQDTLVNQPTAVFQRVRVRTLW